MSIIQFKCQFKFDKLKPSVDKKPADTGIHSTDSDYEKMIKKLSGKQCTSCPNSYNLEHRNKLEKEGFFEGIAIILQLICIEVRNNNAQQSNKIAETTIQDMSFEERLQISSSINNPTSV